VIAIAKPVVSIPEVGVDTISPALMIGIIGIGEREFLEHSKLGLNQVQPRSLRRRPSGMDVQFFEESQELGMIVDVVQVIEHHIEALPWVAFAQLAERLADFGDATARAEDPVQVIAMDIVEGEEMLDPMGALVGSPHAHRPIFFRPRYAARRADFQWPPLVEADHNSAWRADSIEASDQFFLRSK
jgi:hypothetical protein